MLHFGNFAVKGSSGPSSAGRPGGARRPCMAFVGRLITKTYDFIFEVLQIHPQADFGKASRGAEDKGYEYQRYPISVFGFFLGCIEAKFCKQIFD